MSTRSVIARPTPEGGFYGAYCHYDGFPAHQGRILFDAVTGHFDGDPDAACRYLIDQHPAGWSVLHGDVAALPSYRSGHHPEDLRNQCYCHGDRHEPPRPLLTERTARAAHVAYAYVLEAERLRVLTNRPGGWQPVAEPAWTDTGLGCHRPARPTPAPRLVAPPVARSPVARHANPLGLRDLGPPVSPKPVQRVADDLPQVPVGVGEERA